MNVRRQLLRLLYATPRIRGRDHLISTVADSFVVKPVRLPDGLMMYLDAVEWSQLEILVFGVVEPATTALIGKLVTHGDHVIDVGAHVGHHACFAARAAGATGRVLAIDPQPHNADQIARNASLNGLSNLITICAAAGQSNGFIRVPIQSDRDRSRLSILKRGPNDLDVLVEVPLRRLDELVEANGIVSPKLVKIDVEGYELEVLLGMGDRLMDCENIILEVLETADANRTDEIIRLLSSVGFTLRNIEGRTWLAGMELPERNLWATRA